ncbi:MAG TPA: hypothetical protein VIG32_11245 [Candidatus Baltobacteraceae bacterium]
MRYLAIVTFGLFLLAGCSGGGATPSAHPDGWTALAGSSGSTFANGGARFTLKKKPYSGGIKDYASTLTTDTILTDRNAKFVQAVPFPDCPGEAGLQRFTIGGKTPGLLEIGFTVTGNMAITASYFRPKGMPADPAARDAIKTDVCTVVV